MHKEIERAVFKIIYVMEKNRIFYEEARGNYKDTGNEIYQKKMESLDLEYNELKEFISINPKSDVADEVAEIRKIEEEEKFLKRLIDAMFYVLKYFPDGSTLRDLKHFIGEIGQ